VRIEPFGGHALDDRADGVPRDPHQPGDRVLGHLLGQIGDDVLEVAREPRPARPRHRLHTHPAVRALHAPQRADQVAALGAQIEMAPTAQDRVVARTADLPAARADPPPPAQAQRDDDALLSEAHAGDRRPARVERPVECRRGAHVVLLEEPLSFRHPAASPKRRSCASQRAQLPRPRSRAAIPRLSRTLWAQDQPRRPLKRPETPTKTERPESPHPGLTDQPSTTRSRTQISPGIHGATSTSSATTHHRSP
jgi:hypothetical protein